MRRAAAPRLPSPAGRSPARRRWTASTRRRPPPPPRPRRRPVCRPAGDMWSAAGWGFLFHWTGGWHMDKLPTHIEEDRSSGRLPSGGFFQLFSVFFPCGCGYFYVFLFEKLRNFSRSFRNPGCCLLIFTSKCFKLGAQPKQFCLKRRN